jgi:hypothetical protein
MKLTGKNIHGMCYDYVRKPRLYKRQTENAQEFAHRIYLDYCDKKKHESYYNRYFTYRSPFQLDEWLKDTTKTAKLIRTCTRKNNFYRNQNACFSYGTACPYMSICCVEKIDPLVVNLFFDRTNEDREEVNANGNGEIITA